MKKILKHNSFYLIISLLNSSIAFILIPIYVTSFTVSDYGIFSLMIVFYAFLGILITGNIHSSLQTYYFDYYHDKEQLSAYFRHIFSFALLLAFFGTVFFILAGPAIFEAIFTNNYISFYPYGLIVIPSAALAGLNQIYFVLLRNSEELKKYGRLVLISVISNISLQSFFIVSLEWGVTGALLGLLLSNLILFILVLARTGIRFRIGFAPIKKSINYSLWLLPFLLVQWFLARGDRIIVENLIGLAEVGIYALLLNVAMILSVIATSMITSFRPTLFKEFKALSGEISKTVLNLFLYYLGIITITSVAIFILVQNVERFNISSRYYEIKEYILLALVLFSIRVIIRFFNEYLSFLKRSRDLTLLSLFNLFIFLFLLFIFMDQLTLPLLLKIIICCNLVLLIVTGYRCMYLLKATTVYAGK